MHRTASLPKPALPARLKNSLGGPSRRATARASSIAPDLVDDLRHYQGELEIQNKALRFSQAAAEEAYERFVTLFSNVPLALMVVDEHGQILENNARALALLRPLESDPPLTYLLPLVQAGDVDKVRESFSTARDCGVCELAEIGFNAGVHASLTGDLHVARLDHTPGEGVTYICAIVDQGPLISQRSALQASTDTLRLRNDELWQSQTRLAAIINSSLNPIICIDPSHRILVFNPSACTLFECSEAQALGRPVQDFLPDAVSKLAQGSLARHTQWGEISGLTARGQLVPLDVSLSFEHHSDGDIVTLFAHDLTSRKKMEAHRVALEAQLRESQKMQAIGTLAGGIAHDFNNIISAILGNVELARQDVSANVAAHISLSEIDKAGRRARDLVRQILTFSRNEPPRRVALQLADVLHETLRLVKVTLPPHVTLVVRIDPTTPPVMADATQMEQVFLNLFTNAIAAIGDQVGGIEVMLSPAQKAEAPSLEAGDPTEPAVQLRVKDTGCGMDDATMEHVFEPFFTTKPVGQGTGLGLSVVHGIMRAHAGLVQVSSTPGQGSCFTLYFPAAELCATPNSAAAAPPASGAGAGQRVMYVDDDEALVFLVKRVLTRMGYQVITFADPRAAAESLQADPQQCDLLVTDFNMPGYSGVDLLRAVRTIRPGLPVALASGYVTPEIERDALEAGALALIHKPNDVDELCDTVQRLLHDSAQRR
jgi:PAS domain S-box-containing protein